LAKSKIRFLADTGDTARSRSPATGWEVGRATGRVRFIWLLRGSLSSSPQPALEPRNSGRASFAAMKPNYNNMSYFA